MPSDVRAQKATLTDRDAVSQMFAEAFQNDPAMCFIFPDPAVRAARLPSLFKILFDEDCAKGCCYITSGGEAATLWRAPKNARLSFLEKVIFAFPWLNATRSALGRALTYSNFSDANHPTIPHWYLHIAGCAPNAQGLGLGSAVIKAGLTHADARGVHVYLETGKQANVGFYQKFGFAVTHEWKIPNGPKNWSMLRAPLKL